MSEYTDPPAADARDPPSSTSCASARRLRRLSPRASPPRLADTRRLARLSSSSVSSPQTLSKSRGTSLPE
jgi:hypothetical protein